MKKSVITLIAAASLAVPVIALAQQGSTPSIKPVVDVQQEDRAIAAEPAEDQGQVQAVNNDVNDNDAAEATASPTPSPTATPAAEDRMDDGDSTGENEPAQVQSDHHGSNSGHDGSDD